MAEIQNLSPLTQDEYTCLLIAAQGEYLAPIGRWEKSIQSLTAKGLMFRGDAVNYGITQEGRSAVAAAERDDDRALTEVLQKVQGAAQTQKTIQDFAEQAAHLLADGAKASSAITGDLPAVAATNWSVVILKRALELLR